jgi:carboxypeptidase PM20D1
MSFKRIALVFAALLLLLAAGLALNTWRQGSRQLQVAAAPPLAIDEAALAEKLAGALRFQTVSNAEDRNGRADEFRQLHAYLEQRFPLLHARLKREVIDGRHLLYTWPGSDAGAKGVAFLAHHDVVPIAPGTEARWKQPPFAGVVKDGFVWGRGSWDDKGNLVAQMEAVEMLIAAGFQPRQSFYLVSGGDEEIGGYGARKIVALLQQRQVRLDFVIDEGLVLTHGVVPGVQAPVALVGVAEKGYLSVALQVDTVAGHSSMPPPRGTSAIALLSGAVNRLEQEQLPARLTGVGREMFETLAPEMSGLQRVALSNLWLFEPVVRAQLENSPSTNAMLRTTTALTILRAGQKDNVLPGQAQATVNFRILPGETRESVLAHVRSKAGAAFSLQPLPGAYDPTPVTPTSSTAYQQLQRTLRSVFPDAVVAPALYVAGSDSRHFVPIADHIFRFCPVRARPEDLPLLHGTNERIGTANLAEMVRFYHQLLRNLNAPAP